MLTLNFTLKKAILQALKVVPEIQFAIVFGSVAAGTQSSESDLDLAVDAGRPLVPEEKIGLIAELAERIGRPVDLIDLQTAGVPVLGQIVRHGVRILGGNRQYANLIRRHLFEDADFAPYRDRILLERRRAWIGR